MCIFLLSAMGTHSNNFWTAVAFILSFTILPGCIGMDPMMAHAIMAFVGGNVRWLIPTVCLYLIGVQLEQIAQTMARFVPQNTQENQPS